MGEKILTLHPRGKKGVRIDRPRYEAMKKALLRVLGRRPLTHDELTNAVVNAQKGKFEGSIPWYMEATKLDLEARKVIERVSGKTHDVYRVRKG